MLHVVEMVKQGKRLCHDRFELICLFLRWMLAHLSPYRERKAVSDIANEPQ